MPALNLCLTTTSELINVAQHGSHFGKLSFKWTPCTPAYSGATVASRVSNLASWFPRVQMCLALEDTFSISESIAFRLSNSSITDGRFSQAIGACLEIDGKSASSPLQITALGLYSRQNSRKALWAVETTP